MSTNIDIAVPGNDTDIYPDTSVPFLVDNRPVGRNPINLLPDYKVGEGGNTHIPAKGVAPIGPQTDVLRVRHNLGQVILAGDRQYLELAGQHLVGIQPRILPTNFDQSWDENAAINPSIEVV